MDKAYDSEPLHEWLDQRGVWSISPPRHNCRHGVHRKRLQRAFPTTEYAHRNIVEVMFKSLKQRCGGHIRGHSARTIRAELYIRVFLHNLCVVHIEIFYATAPSIDFKIETSRRCV